MQQNFLISNIKKKIEYPIFFFLILISRLPFVSKILYSWDAVQFSLALEKFNVEQHQPHPPGYILYVGLGKFVNFFVGDPNSAYVIISILSSFAIAFLFYNFCQTLFGDKRFFFVSTLILIFIPYFWYYGEVASSYIFDGLFSIAFAYLVLLIFKRQQAKYYLWFSLLLGLSGGFRQSLIVLFLPLWFLALVILIKARQISVKQILLNIVVLGASVLIWFIPLILLSAGWKNYWAVTNWQYFHAAVSTSIFKGAAWQFIYGNFKNIIKLCLAILSGLVVTPVFLLFSKFNLRKITSQKNIIILFSVWLAPSFFVYIFVHFGNAGYLMTVALGMILIFLIPLYLIYKRYGLRRIFLLSVVLIFVSVSCFLLFGSKILSNRRPIALEHKIKKFNLWYSRYTYAAISGFDERMKTIIDEIKKYDPQKTVLVCGKGFVYRPDGLRQYLPASFDYFRHLEFYLPEYDLYELFKADRLQYFHIFKKSPLKINYSNQIRISQAIEKIVIISDNMDSDLISQSSIQTIILANSQRLFLLDIKDKNKVDYWQYEFIKDGSAL